VDTHGHQLQFINLELELSLTVGALLVKV